MVTVASKIEVRRVASLKPYPGNARRHSKSQVRQIASSIRQFGFTNPVLISDEGEIIAGHGRVMAAKEIGLEEIPTLRLSHLSAAERRAYVIADNKLALNAGWDPDILAIELQSLLDINFDLFNGPVRAVAFDLSQGWTRDVYFLLQVVILAQSSHDFCKARLEFFGIPGRGEKHRVPAA